MCADNNRDLLMNKAFIFPGQGSQYISMGQDLYENYPLARQLFLQVNDALGYSLTDIIFSGKLEELSVTLHAQPAIMAVSAVIISVMMDETGKDIAQLCDVVAGHSLGEYSALFAAGCISITDNARLLQIRARAMQDACAAGEGGMAACIGISKNDLLQLIAENIASGVCEIANDNINGQIVISGHIENIDKMVELASTKGYKAIKLNVSGPFHSSLLESAQEVMIAALDACPIQKPAVPIISNFTAQMTQDTEVIKDALVRQVSSTVRWRETLDLFAQIGVTELVEIGPGKVLSGLAKKSGHDFIVHNISCVQDLESWL
jgi:[acyl-carrier-protein] S-malonyltransferase